VKAKAAVAKKLVKVVTALDEETQLVLLNLAEHLRSRT